MFLTNVLLKKSKSKFIMVMMKSLASDHLFTWVRERAGDKAEIIRFDPHINQESVYKEIRKVKSMKF